MYGSLRNSTSYIQVWLSLCLCFLMFECNLFVQIRSDKDKEAKVEYYLAGKGADKPPFNLFIVNPENGFVRITGILDREKCPMYNVSLLDVMKLSSIRITWQLWLQLIRCLLICNWNPYITHIYILYYFPTVPVDWSGQVQKRDLGGSKYSSADSCHWSER